MAQINVTINGRSFRMACDDGEEERLLGLAERFDGWINELRGAFGEIGDQRLTVMAGIMATDQLVELEKKVAALEAELATAKDAGSAARDALNRRESETASAIATAAEKIEVLAESLTKSLKAD
ncbi:cell division protein ZapA [Roseibium aggregatum]|uniref:Cell division protein ZapA n=1 Tax=Roseibium aggregatum TaxID=187304 RepID=A0A926S6A4_9HYPH|nr:cell division protein ZapA [Roseibium aggregatum]MBD1547311.1 cell division protein ZapA [Roseibium aggregatum]